MKNGDVLIVVATMTVVFALISYPLDLVVISVLGLTNGYLASGFLGSLVVALVVGIVFAGKIQESRWGGNCKNNGCMGGLLVFTMDYCRVFSNPHYVCNAIL